MPLYASYNMQSMADDFGRSAWVLSDWPQPDDVVGYPRNSVMSEIPAQFSANCRPGHDWKPLTWGDAARPRHNHNVSAVSPKGSP